MKPQRRSAAVAALVVFVAALAATGGVAGGRAAAADPVPAVPAGFHDDLVASGLTNPAALAYLPDGRLLVAEKGGDLRIISATGVLAPTPVVHVNADSRGDRGLIGVAADPDFVTNGYIYLHYVELGTPSHGRLSRFHLTGDIADSTEYVLADFEPLGDSWMHDGGAIHFGADATLYVAVGDGRVSTNSASLTTRLGKILRYDRNGAIPADNPLTAVTSGDNRAIWAYGLRNPYTFAIEPGTDRMMINDVGEITWEEVNRGRAGANYGWPSTEGPTAEPGIDAPLHTYHHGFTPTTGCAVTGGAFYNPSVASFGETYRHRYFFVDYCQQWIHTLDPDTGSVSDFGVTTGAAPVDLAVAPDGALAYASVSSGEIRAIRYSAAPAAPTIVTAPASATTPAGTPVSFAVGVAGSGPFSFQWRRNTVPIDAATGATYTLAAPTAADDTANFDVVVTGPGGSATSPAATLHVVRGAAPQLRLLSPADGQTYAAGEHLDLQASGTDADTSPLAPSAYTWTVEFHHDTHLHPMLGPVSGTDRISLDIPTEGEPSTNVFLRVRCSVQGASGVRTSITRDLVPRLGRITLTSTLPDAGFVVDGQPQAAVGQLDVAGVVGMTRRVAAAPNVIRPGQLFAFNRWTDGTTTRDRAVTVPAGTAFVQTDYRLERSWQLGTARRLRRHRIAPPATPAPLRR